MIRVEPVPEPANFNTNVRQPGLAYLNTQPPGIAVDFSGREYWRRALSELGSAYRSICAYTCHWIAFDTGSDTVEHFIAKSLHPELAYEWSNFRFVCGRLNGRKGAHTDVVDPFAVVDGMFEIQFPSLQITAGEQLLPADREVAESTINRLKLNDERCIRARQTYLLEFRDQQISFDYLARHAPFLAKELERQGIVNSLPQIMKSN